MLLRCCCPQAHWHAGHKEACRPSEANSEASLEQRLLHSAVLKPEQVRGGLQLATPVALLQCGWLVVAAGT
jgi:hypothetical protein